MPSLASTPTTVLVMGRLLQTALSKEENLGSQTPVDQQAARHSQRHHNLINQITRNIRRTLDLDIIWQQTVDSLGEALQVERCVICP